MSQLLSLSVSYSSPSPSLAFTPLPLTDQAPASYGVLLMCPFIVKHPLLPRFSPCRLSSLACSFLSSCLSESGIILFISLLSAAFSVPPLSSFSLALLAVCSKYRGPPESWREVSMGPNRKEGKRKREKKKLRAYGLT